VATESAEDLESLSLEGEKPPPQSSDGTIVVYTDGACPGNTNVHSNSWPAGWGAVVVEGGDEDLDLDATVIAELWGPVVVDETSERWLGATVTSNNTGELSAVAEALIWLHENHNENAPRDIHIRSDSKYALGICAGKMKPTANLELSRKVHRLYRDLVLKVNLRLSHVKGHSNHKWNDKADELANRGAKGLICNVGRWRRTQTGSECP